MAPLRRRCSSAIAYATFAAALCVRRAVAERRISYWELAPALESVKVLSEKECVQGDSKGDPPSISCDPRNVRLDEDGSLVLTVKEKKGSLSGARVSTFAMSDCQYCSAAVKVKLPGAGGTASARLVPSIQGSQRGEMVLFDYEGGASDLAYIGLRYETEGGSSPGSCGNVSLQRQNDEDSHHFEVKWTPDAILFSVDGDMICSRTSWMARGGDPFPAPYDQPFHLVMDISPSSTSGLVEDGAAPFEPVIMKVQGARMELDPMVGVWKSPREASSGTFGTFLAIAGCIVGPFMALLGTVHPKANCFIMGVLTGAFKAATVSKLCSASTPVIITTSVACGMLLGYFSIHIASVARYKTVGALSISTLYFFLDIGLLLALGSRLAIIVLFIIVSITFTLLAFPERNHFWAFFCATAIFGGCILKLSIQQLISGPVEVTKLLDDPLAIHCLFANSCGALLPVWIVMTCLGLAAQFASLKLRPKATARALQKWREAQTRGTQAASSFQQRMRRVRESTREDETAQELLSIASSSTTQSSKLPAEQYF